jgi:uncharacterized protein
MPGKKQERMIWHEPLIHFFNPQPVPPASSDYPTEELTYDELEAMRLRYLDEKSQIDGAELMNISQPTFHRILTGALKKVTTALVDGKSIHLILGNSRTFKYGYGCMECDHETFLHKEKIEDIEKMLPLDGVVCSNENCRSPNVYRLLREITSGESKHPDVNC